MIRATNATLAAAAALLLLGGMLEATGQAHLQLRTLEPVDEGRTDPSWTAFRDRLLGAVRARDRSFVLSIVDPEVKTSFSDQRDGLDGFQRQWELHDPTRSPLWNVLEEILTLGGTFTAPGIFCGPYVSTQFPSDVDAAYHEVVIRESVPVFDQPSTDSRVVARLSFDIVKTEPSDVPERIEGQGWVFVHLSNGQSGYVQKVNVRSPLDYRACFAKTGVSWRMTMLLAGD